MSFNIFNRHLKEEKYQREIRKLMTKICQKCNPYLLFELEKSKKHQGEIYFAIKEVLETFMLQNMPDFYPKGSKLLAMIGKNPTIKILKEMNKDDPLTTFCLLAEIYSRLFTEEEFRRLCGDFLGFSPQIMEAMIFNNPNITLRFQES